MFLKIIKEKEFLPRFFILATIIFFFVFPIIHANIYYQDDYVRAEHGWIAMESGGRYLSFLIFIFLNMNKHINDIAPATQIIAIFSLAFALSFYSISWKYNRISLVAILFIVCSPSAIECLSYKFDSLTMSLAVSSIIIFFGYRSKEIAREYGVKTCLALCSLNLYQATLGFFLSLLSLCLILIFYDETFKRGVCFLLKSIFCLFLALIIYKIEVVIFGVNGLYSFVHSSTTYNINNIVSNYTHFSQILAREFGFQGGNLERFVGICTVGGISAVLYKFYRKLGARGVALALCVMAACLLTLYGPMVLLQHPVFKLRVLLGSGVFLCLLMTFVVGRSSTYSGSRILPITLAGCVLGIQIIFSYEWGNAVHQQALLNEYVAGELVEDIYTLSDGEKVSVRVMSRSQKEYDRLNAELSEVPLGIGSEERKYIIRERWWEQPTVYAPVAPMAAAVWRRRRAIWDSLPMVSTAGWIGVLMDKQGLQSNATFLAEDEEGEFPLDWASKMRSNCSYDRAINRRFYSAYYKDNNILIDFTHNCLKK